MSVFEGGGSCVQYRLVLEPVPIRARLHGWKLFAARLLGQPEFTEVSPAGPACPRLVAHVDRETGEALMSQVGVGSGFVSASIRRATR